jgi:hypothetical protein
LAAGPYNCNVTVAAPGAFAADVIVTLVVSPRPVINAATTPLAFAFVQGGTAPASQTVAVTSTPSQAVTSAVATTSGGNWLGAVLSGGTLTVSAIPTGLAAGTYNGSITLSSSLAANVTIQVSFVVTTPVISCTAANADFAFLKGAAVPAPQTATCTTTPSGLALSSAVATTTGGAWLTASLSSGTLTITAAPGTLANGVYNGSVTISTPGAANVVIPASLTVTTPVIIAPTAQVNYNFVIGGTAPGSQAVAVTTTPTGVAVTATPSAAWLVASLSGSTLSISVNQAGLAAGTYSGFVTLTAPGAANVVIPVVFGVAAQPVIGPVTPGSLSFAYTTGGSLPAAQSVIVGNASNLTLSATPVGTWLSATLSPASGNPAGLTVSVNPTGLAAGTYNGSITLAGAGAVSVSIPVSFTVTTAATIPFFTGQVALSNGVYYLSFPNGGLFGYFSYISSGLIYHFDMGYEAVQNANDGSNGVYMYDFKSGHWWYSNPASFPYIYDFTLHSWIYYFPSTAGHYTTNPRSFANLTTGLVFTM